MAPQQFDEDNLLRARDYVERLEQDTIARAELKFKNGVRTYWHQRRGLFRYFASLVVSAAQRDLDRADALSHSIRELEAQTLDRTAAADQRETFQAWFRIREPMLRQLASKLWEMAIAEEPPRSGFAVALEAQPNPDFGRARRGTLSIPLRWERVRDLAEAQNNVEQFLATHDLGSGNWVRKAGQVTRDGRPYARISFNRRIWAGWSLDSKLEMDVNGNPMTSSSAPLLPPQQSFKVEVLAHGGWSSNAQRYETQEQAQAAGESLFSRWTAVEKFRVVPSSDPPNQAKPASAPPAPTPAPPSPAADTDQKVLFMYVGDKKPKPPTPQIPPPLPMQAYVKPTTEQSPATEEETVLRYSMQIKGRWGKKRTDDFLSIDLAKRIDPSRPLPMDTLLTMMRNKADELKVKPGAIVALVEQPWTISAGGIERTVLTSARKIHTETWK